MTRPPPSKPRYGLIFVGIALVIIVGAGAWMIVRQQAGSAASSSAIVATAPEPVGAAAAHDAAAAAELVRDYVFGGRTIAWWSSRLSDTRESDPELYALTRKRAERSGLVVTERHNGVSVHPSEALMTTIAARLSSK